MAGLSGVCRYAERCRSIDAAEAASDADGKYLPTSEDRGPATDRAAVFARRCQCFQNWRRDFMVAIIIIVVKRFGNEVDSRTCRLAWLQDKSGVYRVYTYNNILVRYTFVSIYYFMCTLERLSDNTDGSDAITH